MTSRIAAPRHLVARVAGRAAALLAVSAGVAVSAACAAPPEATPTRTRVVDPAVRPAGGVGCTACGPAGCRHAHHPGCRDGVCVPYCPVRPQQFGYYGTRWRKWPGQQIVQVSGEQPAAPVQPPRSEVPGADEESNTSRSIEPPLEDADGVVGPPAADAAGPMPDRPLPPAEPREPRTLPRAPAPEPAAPMAPEPARGLPPELKRPEPAFEPEPEPRQPEPEPESAPKQPEPEPKQPEPAPERPEDENLFEVLSGSGWRARRQFAVGPAAGGGQQAGPAADGRSVLPAAHARPVAAAHVPPVPFDPAAETRRLRGTR